MIHSKFEIFYKIKRLFVSLPSYFYANRLNFDKFIKRMQNFSKFDVTNMMVERQFIDRQYFSVEDVSEA